MIWSIILGLYFIAGVIIGYRTHKLKNLKKITDIEKRAMMLADFYTLAEAENDRLRNELSILKEENGAGQRIRFANENEKLRLANDLMKSHLKAIGYEPDEMLKKIMGS